MILAAKLHFIALACLCLMVACAPQLRHLVGQTQGTTYSIKYYPANSTAAPEVVGEQVKAILQDVDLLASNYRPDSHLARFNQAPPNVPQAVPQELLDRLQIAFKLHQMTNGLYDPTVGPLVNVWGFGRHAAKEVPSSALVAKALKQVGLEKLILGHGTITKQVPGMFLDLNSSVPGYTVDRLAQLLESHGSRDWMIELGGEVRARGQGPQGAWRIGIESPGATPTGPVALVVALSNAALATSGNYRHFFEKGGKKYSHTINPKTGIPTDNDIVSVTVVVDGSCEWADAMATALMLMGSDQALAFAESQQLPALFILAHGQNSNRSLTKSSSAWQQRFGPH